MPQDRREVPGVREQQGGAGVVADQAAEDGGGDLGHVEALDQPVEPVQHHRGAAALIGVGAQHAAQLPHRCRGRHVVAHHVADRDPDRPVGQLEQVNQSPPTWGCSVLTR
jgi:hypothetical protein